MRIMMFVFAFIAALACVSVASAPTTNADGKSKKTTRMDISIELPERFDPQKPEIRIRYTLIEGGDAFDLRLPGNEREMRYFFNFVVSADGVKLTLVNEGARVAEVGFSRRIALKVGESATLTVPIYNIYKLPQKWKALEVVPTRSEVPPSGYTGVLKIINEEQKSP